MDQPTKHEHRRRLLETTSWCLRHAILDPQRDLRTPELKPLIADDWPTLSELNAALGVLATRRRELLAGVSRVDVPGGRVLICEFNASITSGESEEATN